MYHRFVTFFFGLQIRDTDCDFRLIRHATLDRVRLVHTTGVICVELVRKLQDAGARFTEVGVHHYRRVLREVGVLPARRHPPHAVGTSPGSGCGWSCSASGRTPVPVSG